MDRTRLKPIAAVLVLGCLAASFALWSVTSYVLDLVQTIREAGAWGALGYGAVYIAATVLMVPGALITALAGSLYGVLGGVLVVWPASLIGASLAFLGGRFLARDWVQRLAARQRHTRAIDQAIYDRSFTVILLLRLSPLVPFSLLNYVLGATRASYRHYVWASAIGMLPGTVLYVYLGSLVTDVAALSTANTPSTGIWGQILWGVGLLATFIVTVMLSRMARARLQQHLGRPDR